MENTLILDEKLRVIPDYLPRIVQEGVIGRYTASLLPRGGIDLFWGEAFAGSVTVHRLTDDPICRVRISFRDVEGLDDVSMNVAGWGEPDPGRRAAFEGLALYVLATVDSPDRAARWLAAQTSPATVAAASLEAPATLARAGRGADLAEVDLAEYVSDPILRAMLELWRDGYTAGEIALKQNSGKEKTIRNRLTKLRQELGRDLVPFAKDLEGIGRRGKQRDITPGYS